jgi:hypothetical protein
MMKWIINYPKDEAGKLAKAYAEAGQNVQIGPAHSTDAFSASTLTAKGFVGIYEVE